MSEPLKPSTIAAAKTTTAMADAFARAAAREVKQGRPVTETGDVPDGDTPPSLVAKNAGAGNV